MNQEVSLLDAKTLEIHYYLNDGSHSIDAKAFYACQQELVGLIEFIAKQLSIDVSVETIALEEGGIKSWLKANGLTHIVLPLIVTVAGNILSTAPSETIARLVNYWVDEYIESPEVKELKKKQTERDLLLIEEEIDSLKKEKQKFQSQTVDTTIRAKRSKFYENAARANNLNKIEFIQRDHPKAERGWTLGEVSMDKFVSYKLASTEIDPIEEKDALIEIISPVLTRGKRKWVGNYSNNPYETKRGVSFSVQDADFLQDVWSRKVSFSNGNVIRCWLKIKRKVNDKGEEVVSGYEVLEVFELLANGVAQTLPTRKKKIPPPSDEPDLFSGQYD